MNIVLVVFVAVLVPKYNKAQQTITCNKQNEDKMSETVNRLSLFGSIDRKYPITNSEMQIFCNEQIEIQSWIKNYSNKCLNNLSKQVFTLFMYTNAKVYNDICKSSKRKRDFLKLGYCGNAAKNDTVKCYSNLAYSVEDIRHYNDHKMKLPLLCCNYNLILSCLLKSYEKYPIQCKQSTIDSFENILNKQVIDVMKLMCGEYTDDNDKCDKIIGLVPKSNLKVVLSSPIWPLINLLSSLPDN